MNDILRAAIISLIQSAFPVLQITGIINFTGDEIATIMVFVTNAVTFLFLAVKYGQQSSGSTSTVTASVSTGPEPPKP